MPTTSASKVVKVRERKRRQFIEKLTRLTSQVAKKGVEKRRKPTTPAVPRQSCIQVLGRPNAA